MNRRSNVLIYNIAAVIIGLAISAAMLLFMKIDPITVIAEAGRKILTDKYTTGEILVKATPLIFTSLAFAFTYQANLFNIGAQGHGDTARGSGGHQDRLLQRAIFGS